MIKVQFTVLDEFFEEAFKIVKARVMRVTVLQELIAENPAPLLCFNAVAGLVNTEGQIVELLWRRAAAIVGNDGEEEAYRRAEEAAQQIRVRAKQLGFEIRAGRYVSAEDGQ